MKTLLSLLLLLTSGCFSNGQKAAGQAPNTFSIAEKIYGLSTIWKEVEYNFAYFEKIGSEKWDSLYKTMIAKF